jgi:hypothetical protein
MFVWLPSEKCKIVSCKKTEFEDLEDLLVSCELEFVTAGYIPCTMYYFLKIYVVLIIKKCYLALMFSYAN